MKEFKMGDFGFVFRIEMFLNLDFYEDLFREFIILGDENPEIVSGFILSGRESVGGMRGFMRKIETIHFWNSLSFDDSSRLQCSYYVVELRWVSIWITAFLTN